MDEVSGAVAHTHPFLGIFQHMPTSFWVIMGALIFIRCGGLFVAIYKSLAGRQ
ncbi:MAG: hypothetical protein U1F34_08960 [Gammaproteobacteria bacterium]